MTGTTTTSKTSKTMQPLAALPVGVCRTIRWLLCDIDDTVTTDGRLPAASLLAMERLQTAGVSVVPITGRPGGWCDHIARMWPVDAVVGENGALYFRYDRQQRRMIRVFFRDAATRASDRQRLDVLRREILAAVPGCGIASDQPYRDADLAIDFCEDVAPLSRAQIHRIAQLFEEAGAHAKISSIHVNGWFGDYDKLTMARRLFAEQFNARIEDLQDCSVFIGDSPNDAPMFGEFRYSIGVANIIEFADDLTHRPKFTTKGRNGDGFVELCERILAAKHALDTDVHTS